MESYGITAEEFPQIKFSSKKKGKEYNCLHANKEIIKDAWDTWSKYGKSSDALMIYFMFVYELSPEDIRLLKFEDLIIKNNQASIKVYRTKNKNYQKIPISKYLYNKIMKYEKDLIKEGNWYMANRLCDKEQIVGNFMFKDSKSTIVKKFQTKFGGLLKNFDICPKDLTISSIDNQSINSPLNFSEELLEIKNSKKKRKDFKGTSAYSNKTKKVTTKSKKT